MDIFYNFLDAMEYYYLSFKHWLIGEQLETDSNTDYDYDSDLELSYTNYKQRQEVKFNLYDDLLDVSYPTKRRLSE